MVAGIFGGGVAFLLGAAWIVVALAAVSSAVVVTASSRARGHVLTHYPLGWATWTLMAPFMVALILAVAIGASVLADGDIDAAAWATIPLLALALCIAVGVWSTRARTGRMNHWPWLPALAGFGVPMIVVVLATWIDGPSVGLTAAALALALVCGANGLVVLWANVHRRHAFPGHSAAPPPADYRHEVPPPPQSAPPQG